MQLILVIGNDESDNGVLAPDDEVILIGENQLTPVRADDVEWFPVSTCEDVAGDGR